jgi:VIT1/CCC1 family predicted Fe2+/Mn2+ transporter
MSLGEPPQRAVLDPVERVSEIVLGVLMALTFTGSVSVATAGGEVLTMMFAAFGCNVAWGLADAVMYLVGTRTERTRTQTLVRRLRAAADATEARRLLAEALPDGMRQIVGPEELEAMRRRIGMLPEARARARLRPQDYAGAAGVFVLVVLATFPVVLPFLFIRDSALAIRASNGAALVTLFLGGWALGRYSGGSPWRTGFAMTAIGGSLVGVIVGLGG